jgi:hypothetical protein
VKITLVRSFTVFAVIVISRLENSALAQNTRFIAWAKVVEFAGTHARIKQSVETVSFKRVFQ